MQPNRPLPQTTTTPVAHLSPAQLRGQIAFVRAAKQSTDLWVINPKTRVQHLIMRDVRDTSYLDISPDLTKVVIGDNDGKMTIRSLDGKVLRKIQLKTSSPDPSNSNDKTPYLFPGYVSLPRWSPDGTRIAYTVETGYIEGGNSQTGTEVRVINADGTNDHHIEGTTYPGGFSAARPVWSRDGKRLLFGCGPAYDQNLPEQKAEYRTAAFDGSDVRPFDGDMSSFNDITVSRDGKEVLKWEKWTGDTVLTLHSLPSTPDESRTLLGSMAYETAGFSLIKFEATFSPDGKQVVFEGTLDATYIDNSGHLSFPSSSQENFRSITGIFITKAGSDKPQLLIKNASLVKWL